MIVVVAGFSTLGRLIVTRAGNVLGWVFLVMGAALALGLPGEGYLDVAFREPYVASLPGTEVAGLLANAFPAVMAYSIPILFLLFPTGSPPTPRWRWVIWMWLTGTILSGIWLLFRPGNVYAEPGRYRIRTRSASSSCGRSNRCCSTSGWRSSSRRRWRPWCPSSSGSGERGARSGNRSRGCSWSRSSRSLLMLTMFVLDLFGIGEDSDVLWIALLMVLVLGIPGATALAIFRYRLYDVDVVVSKTIAYGGLALGIALVYGAIVIGLGALIGDESDEALRLGAAILVAIAVQPAWSLFNRLANRLVYGGRSTPYQVMAEFGDRIAQIPSVDELLPDMAEAAARGVGARAARVRMFLPGPEGADRVRSATWPSETDVGEPDLTLPIEHAGETIGDLAVAKSARRSPPADRADAARGSRGARRHRSRERTPLRGPRSGGRRSSRRRPTSSGVRGSASSRSETRSGAGSSRSSGTVSAPRSRRSGTRSATTRHASSRSPTACAIPWSG